MAVAALISSLAMLAAGPQALTLAQADAPAAATSPAEPAAAPAQDEGAAPSGAPADDYGLMAWCYGALSGHLGLYQHVLPQVRRIETEFLESGHTIDEVMGDYAAQHAAGEKTLTSWAHVLTIEEAAGKTGGRKRAVAIARGRMVWKGADSADPRQLAQLWMSWGLPDKCRTTAHRLAP